MSRERDPRGVDGFDDHETLAALAAVEGLGVIGQDAANVDPDLVLHYESAAGLVFRALTERRAPAPPADLVERLQGALMPRVIERSGGASDHARSPASRHAERHGSGVELRTGHARRSDSGGPSVPGNAVGRSILAFSGWLAAAAAVLFFTLGGEESAAEPSVAALELAQADDAIVAPWSVGDLEGDVVWSDAANAGFMRINGLPANDPTETQYQLWIFRGQDPSKEDHPVDGGVFDVPASGEVVIPIDAKLNVGHAGLFAVTVEEPGGVVVSKREAIVAVAARG